VRGLPSYRTGGGTLVKATAAGAVVAVAVGALWGFFPAWQFYLALALGFGVAEAMAWTARYKRGSDLQVAAVACVLLGLAVSRVVMAEQSAGLGASDLLTRATDPGVAAMLQLRLIPDLLFAALAFVIPFVRFR
ncbi:MAG: hypothetical protein IRY97_06730, partial [Thermomicrobiaceae bacterium]|nr:hypothetical protein [Thermomicrobiaceae bacterium]